MIVNFNKISFQQKLFSWYEINKRDLPWRHTNDPYKIWLSEIILQQTRVNQGLPYYERFVEKYPDIKSLAIASEDEVLRLWQGLGYYSRARNMLATAKNIFYNLKEFPNNYKEILKLKGIGTYTAAAIASFAFKEKVAVLDGNVYRVLSRIFGIQTDISLPAAKKEFTELANSIISVENPDIFNQAMMELGAILCTPMPQCLLCPFNDICYAFLNEKQKELPVKNKKIKIKELFFHYYIFEYQGKIGMKQRINKDIWQGLFDFYLIETDSLMATYLKLEDEILNKIIISSEKKSDLQIYSHQLTHRKIFAQFVHVILNSENIKYIEESCNVKFYSPVEVDNLPKPTLIVKYLIENTHNLYL